MLISEYNDFVKRSDQSSKKNKAERIDIAIFGLVSEIGSVLAAIKKQLLSEEGIENWDHANEEIIEELGDVIWYCFQFSQIHNEGRPVNIFKINIALLKQELSAEDERAQTIHAVLDKGRRDDFLRAASNFPKLRSMRFNDYQEIANLTARTEGRVLLQVCLVILWQLGSELLQKKLPPSEMSLGHVRAARDPNIVLGDIAWHLACIASIYGLSLNSIAAKNIEKLSFRLNRDDVTGLHDEGWEAHECFPSVIEIAFVTVSKGRSRMYHKGVQIGNELTDNNYEDDGYRFHDVMHLANVAKLGWSPVLRSQLGVRRQSDKRVNEVEDGARAKIVEEAIVKAIHSEGRRLAEQENPFPKSRPRRLFPRDSDITFKFLKFVNTFVAGLEVHKNKYWEWEQAILEGYRIFFELSKEEQGTVTVDLSKRSISFRPDVYIDIQGAVAGIGTALVTPSEYPSDEGGRTHAEEVLTDRERTIHLMDYQSSRVNIARIVAVKRAILDALSIDSREREFIRLLDISLLDGRRASIKAHPGIQEIIWGRNIVNFKTTLTEYNNVISCTALAISDPGAKI